MVSVMSDGRLFGLVIPEGAEVRSDCPTTWDGVGPE